MDPVGQISAQRPQYMHLQISISKWLNDRCFVSLFISIPIVIQVIGQTRSQARQPVQISMSTSRIPRYLRGSISCTGFSILSGYWIVIGRRTKWEKVMAIPSKIVVTVSTMLPTYSTSVLIGFFKYRVSSRSQGVSGGSDNSPV